MKTYDRTIRADLDLVGYDLKQKTKRNLHIKSQANNLEKIGIKADRLRLWIMFFNFHHR